ncbi:hypothetical protein MMC28_003470 [Mycoblastus sanguinarius]|nr:hypothetical protein [Mycoblastus sanguinarius]
MSRPLNHLVVTPKSEHARGKFPYENNPRQDLILTALPNEMLLDIFEAVYPPGAFDASFWPPTVSEEELEWHKEREAAENTIVMVSRTCHRFHALAHRVLDKQVRAARGEQMDSVYEHSGHVYKHSGDGLEW